MSQSIYTDPNCTSDVRWNAWREVLQGAGAGAGIWLGPEAAIVGHWAYDAYTVAELEAARLDLSSAEVETCFLGVAALMLMQVSGAWRRGRFFAAVQAFAVLHDQFLTNIHPGFCEASGWPLGDASVRAWKDRLLFQTRRFRELGGARLRDGAFDQGDMQDPVEIENLGSMANHALQQGLQQQRRLPTSAPRDAWWAAKRSEDANASELSSKDFMPHWEMGAVASLVYRPSERLPVRVYVYGEDEVPALGAVTKSPAFCHYRQWGMDVGFHDFFRTSPLRTFDPEEADYFFVPSYACCHQVAGMYEFHELDALHADVVRSLPYFARSSGRDHIFSFHYVDLFPTWRRHIPRSVFLTPETEVGFDKPNIT